MQAATGRTQWTRPDEDEARQSVELVVSRVLGCFVEACVKCQCLRSFGGHIVSSESFRVLGLPSFCLQVFCSLLRGFGVEGLGFRVPRLEAHGLEFFMFQVKT